MQAIKDFFAEIFAESATYSISPTLRTVLVTVSLTSIIIMIIKIRSKQFHIDDSLFWIGSAGTLLLISIFPNIAFFWSAMLGIKDPTNLVFLIVLFIVIAKIFFLTIESSIQKHRLNTLVQKLALANEKIEATNKKLADNEKK